MLARCSQRQEWDTWNHFGKHQQRHIIILHWIPLLCVLAPFSEDTHIITQPERPSGKATSVIFSCRLKLAVETPVVARSSSIQQGGKSLLIRHFFWFKKMVLGRGRDGIHPFKGPRV